MRTAALVLALSSQLLSATAGAQTTSGNSSALGLGAVGAFGIHVAGASIQRGYSAAEFGGHLDLGHLKSNRVRVTVDAAFLRTFLQEEFVAAEDVTYRDVFYDLSGNVCFTVFGRDPHRRLLPYVAAGTGVHVLTSSFGTVAIDRRYNTNNFGLLGAVGVRVRPRLRSRQAFLLEVRRIQAENVSRTSLHVGILRLFADLR